MPLTLLSQGDTVRLATVEAATGAVFDAAARAEAAAQDVEGVGIVVENLPAILDAPNQAMAAQVATAQGQVVLNQTEAARDASVVNAQTYATEAAGRAAVTDGRTFDVQGNANTAVLRYRRLTSTTSELIASFPSTNAFLDPTSYNPSLAFRLATSGWWFDYSDKRQLFTDAARTLPVMNIGDLVAGAVDKSGFGTHSSQTAAASRPAFAETEEGLRGLRFDGVDDFLSHTGSIYTATGATTVVMAVQLEPNPAGCLFSEASNANTSLYSLRTGGPDVRSGTEGNNLGEIAIEVISGSGTTNTVSSNENPVDFQNRIVTIRDQPDGGGIRRVEMWIDDRKQPLTVRYGSSRTFNTAAIGAIIRSAVTNFLKGFIFEAVGVNVTLSDAEVYALQCYMARKHFHNGRSAEGSNSPTNYRRLAILRGRALIPSVTPSGGVRVTDLSISPEGFRGPAYSTRSNVEQDTHGAPAILITAAEKVVLLNWRHSNSTINTSISKPGTITEWETHRQQTPVQPNIFTYGYPRIVENAGLFHLFLRAYLLPGETTTQRGLWTMTTPDLAAVDFSDRLKLIAGDRPYADICQNGDRIDMLVSTGNPADGGPINDVAHCYYILSERKLYATDGTPLVLPATVPVLTNLHSQAATGLKSWLCGPPWLGRDGHPRAVYIRYNADGSQDFMFRRWTGSAWTAAVVLAHSAGATYSGATSGGEDGPSNGHFYADPLDPSVVFLGRNIAAEPGTSGHVAPHQIWRYVTEDNGQTWLGTQLTFEKFTCNNACVSSSPMEPRLIYGTGPGTGYDDFAGTRIKLVHSGTGRAV